MFQLQLLCTLIYIYIHFFTFIYIFHFHQGTLMDLYVFFLLDENKAKKQIIQEI